MLHLRDGLWIRHSGEHLNHCWHMVRRPQSVIGLAVDIVARDELAVIGLLPPNLMHLGPPVYVCLIGVSMARKIVSAMGVNAPCVIAERMQSFRWLSIARGEYGWDVCYRISTSN